MGRESDDWRREIEEAIAEGDETHLRIVLDRVFSEIDEAIFPDLDEWEL